MRRDSPDYVIREVQPEAVTEAEASLRAKDIVAAVQSDRAGQGNKVHRLFSAEEPKGRRKMVIEGVHVIDEESRSATAAAFSKQCAWLKLGRDRIEKTQLAKPCSHGAMANQLLPRIDL